MFIHLNLHSEYALVDGVIRIPQLIDAVVAQQMPAVAITDRCNLFAAVKFYRAATQAGVKPIFGSELLLADPHGNGQTYPLILLCQNQIGYRNLACLLTKAYRESQGVTQVHWAWLQQYAQGLIVLSGGCDGLWGQLLLAGKHDLAEQSIREWQSVFPDRFYVEVHRVGHEHEGVYIREIASLATCCHVPIVATNRVCFLAADDFTAHEARVCIQSGYVLNDPKRPKLYTEQQYLRSPQEMAELFADLPEALANSVAIAKRCNVSLQLGDVFLPNFPTPDAVPVADYLGDCAQQGLTARLGDTIAEEYTQRLHHELSVINRMGYAGYFLIVADFIQWAKQHEVPVGPGRGSGAGSLVAYVLGITDLDPLQYDLLFERFLNPERVSMPDFDIDFCMEGRDRVIEYVANKYGHDCVSQIITFGTMAARAVVRDVGRVLGHPYGFIDKIAKLIPFELGITLQKAMEQADDLQQRYADEEEVKAVIDLAQKLEGLARNAGKHAGGVVIAPSALMDYTPLYCESADNSLVTQFDKDDVEAVGLVKFDFLGLRTLTIIKWAEAMIKQQYQTAIDITHIPLDDAPTFALLKACKTTAVFQLESRGMKDLMKRLQPDCFEEIVALVALFRPGPLQSGMVDEFIDCKHGRAEVAYLHPMLESILKPTYGVILYQEQVMQIAQVLAGYTLGSADLLRRAMGKKKPAEMAKQRVTFLQGAVERGIDKQVANTIFDLMEKFAGYGFNKSHSAAYALVAYQTAWLKVHYPAAFMAAVLSADIDNTDKIVSLLQECKQLSLDVLSPNVNRGDYLFTVADETTIVYGLGAIKGIGRSVVETIVSRRHQEGDFVDLFEFCRRIDLSKVSRRSLEVLIRSGALDDFGSERAVLMANLDAALKTAEQQLANQKCGQPDLFGSQELTQPVYVEATPWTDLERLQGERDTLGFYLTGHVLDAYRAELQQLTSCTISALRPDKQDSVVLAGIVVAVRKVTTKKGNQIAFVSIDDGTGVIDIALFSEVYQMHKALLTKDSLLIVEGDISLDDFTGKQRMLARHITSLEHARSERARALHIHLKASQCTPNNLNQLADVLTEHQQNQCSVYILYQATGASALLKLDEQWKIAPNQLLLDALTALVGQDQVMFHYN